MRKFRKGAGALAFAPGAAKVAVIALFGIVVGAAVWIFGAALERISSGNWADLAQHVAILLAGASLLVALGCLVLLRLRSPQKRIEDIARRVLGSYKYGNPLGLSEGQMLPLIRCSVVDGSLPSFRLRVTGYASTVEQIEAARSALSSGLRGRFEPFSVVRVDAGAASQYVDFYLEDVLKDRRITVNSLDDLETGDVTRLRVQEGLEIDLTSSGSILVAGKTRSGKTSGILSLLLAVAAYGPDEHRSALLIVDPKRAELSRLPGVLIPDESGEAREILDRLRDFERTIQSRQNVLNIASDQVGDAVKWWDVGMHPSFVFLDEFVALRSMFPTSTAKEFAGYRLKDFDAVLRRIITMGASAGCFVIVSIAQANAEQLPTMLRDAFSTRILFRPTPDEGRLLWDSTQINGVPPRIYGPGEAWFSSSDGMNDAIRQVQFPWWSESFKPYAALAHLLKEYDHKRQSLAA